MMKTILMILVSTMFIINSPSVIQATPMYLTFSGQISSVDGNDYNDWPGHVIGESVTYVFLIDTEIDGTLTRNNGTIDVRNDTATLDQFHADFIDGSLVESLNGGYYSNIPGYASELNYGYINSSNHVARLVGESWDDYTGINSRSTYDWNGWIIGQWYDGIERAYTNRIERTIWLESNLQLSAVQTEDEYFSGQTPVPEPATMMLFGIGLLGLAGVSRRKNNKKFL